MESQFDSSLFTHNTENEKTFIGSLLTDEIDQITLFGKSSKSTSSIKKIQELNFGESFDREINGFRKNDRGESSWDAEGYGYREYVPPVMMRSPSMNDVRQGNDYSMGGRYERSVSPMGLSRSPSMGNLQGSGFGLQSKYPSRGLSQSQNVMRSDDFIGQFDYSNRAPSQEAYFDGSFNLPPNNFPNNDDYYSHQNFMLQRRSVSSPSFENVQQNHYYPPTTHSPHYARKVASPQHMNYYNQGNRSYENSGTTFEILEKSGSNYENKLHSPRGNSSDYSDYHSYMSRTRSSPNLNNDGNVYHDPGPVLSRERNFFPTSSENPKKFERSNSKQKMTLNPSSKLEEFRSSKNNNHFELNDIIGHMIEFSCDQHGSRFIQQKLESCSDEDKNLVFSEIFPSSLTLMMDVFGNYVIQKFFEHGTPEEKIMLTERILGYIVKFSMQVYGCRIVQKAVECMSEKYQLAIIEEIKDSIVECINDQNGNHVVQKIIEEVDPKYTEYIVDQFVETVYEMSTHPYGCRVIQRVLEYFCLGKHHSEYYNYQNSPASIVLVELFENTPNIIRDQYGNYVIQHVLKNGRPSDISSIVAQLEGDVVEYCQHKFASNVIEKCIIYGSFQDRNLIIEELVENPESLEKLLKHQYANYVFQKILDECSKSQKDLMVTHILPFLPELHKYTYAKHIISRLEKLQNS